MDKTQKGLLISGVYHSSSPVQEGDFILEIHGLTHHEIMGYALGLFNPQKDTGMVVLRGSKIIHLPYRTVPYTILSMAELIWPILLLITVFLILGTIALYQGTGDPAPTLFFLMLCSLSVSLCATIPSMIGFLSPVFFSSSFLLQAVSNWISFGLWAHFALRFPEHRDLVKHRWWIPAGLYLLPAATTILGSFYAADMTPEFFGWVQRLRNIYLPFIIIGVFFKHLTDYIKTYNPQLKNQIKLPMIAYWLTFTPYLFFYLLPNLISDAPLISFRIVVFAFFILPMAYLGAILKYRLFNINRIISRTIAYFTVIICLSIIYSLFLAAMKKWFFGDQILSKELFLLFLIIVNIIFHPLILKLEHVIRRFVLRDQSISVKLMHQFSNKISATLHLPDLIMLVIRELPEAIHIKSAAIMTFEENRSRLFPDHLRFGKKPWVESRIVERFKNGTSLYFSCSLQETDDMRIRKELEEIRKTGFDLIFPLKGATSLSALLFLGPKNNGSPFNEEDIHILASFANQAGTALENAIHHEFLVESKKQLEEMFDRKVHSEKMAAIGEMTSLLAHELKNPLSIIHSSAQYLADRKQSWEITREMLHYIKSEAEHLNLSINSILKFARQKPPEFEKIDLEHHMHDLISQWQRSDSHKPFIDIVLDIQKGTYVHADLRQLNQVLYNLIRNSEDTMENTGHIIISVTGSADHVLISIHDDGPGIPEDITGKIFKKFFTTKPGGLGLGLAVCRQIIQAHNGSITLENHAEGGALAVVKLPVKPLTTLNMQEKFQRTLLRA